MTTHTQAQDRTAMTRVIIATLIGQIPLAVGGVWWASGINSRVASLEIQIVGGAKPLGERMATLEEKASNIENNTAIIAEKLDKLITSTAAFLDNGLPRRGAPGVR